MIHLIRRFQQPLLIVVTVVIIIAFAWLYNDTRYMDQLGADRVGTIYGRSVSQAQFLREGRKVELTAGLTRELFETLAQAQMAESQDQMVENFVWNTMVLRHEADALGLVPTSAEIEEAIRNLPAFRTNGVYDSSKYNMLVANGLAPRGLSADALAEIVADDLRLEKIKTVLGSTVAPVASELRTFFDARNTRMEAQVVRWKFADFLKDAQVTDEDLAKAYEERKKTLLTDEQRKVKFVAFTLPPAEKPLVGKERVEAIAPLKTKTEEFAVAMTEAGAKFEEVAAKLGAKVQETPAFAVDAPPAELGQDASVAAAAFRLTKEQPNSDPVQTEKGYYLLQLAEIVPAREQTLDEAKPKLAETLKNERALESMTLKATEARNKIDAELKAGKTFAEAAAAAGVKPEPFPAFSFGEPPFKEPDGSEVMMAMRDLEPGQISSFQTTGMTQPPTGGLLVFLDKKLPADEAKFAQESPMLAEQIARTKREAIFMEWFRQRRAAAGLLTARARS